MDGDRDRDGGARAGGHCHHPLGCMFCPRWREGKLVSKLIVGFTASLLSTSPCYICTWEGFPRNSILSGNRYNNDRWQAIPEDWGLQEISVRKAIWHPFILWWKLNVISRCKHRKKLKVTQEGGDLVVWQKSLFREGGRLERVWWFNNTISFQD